MLLSCSKHYRNEPWGCPAKHLSRTSLFSGELLPFRAISSCYPFRLLINLWKMKSADSPGSLQPTPPPFRLQRLPELPAQLLSCCSLLCGCHTDWSVTSCATLCWWSWSLISPPKVWHTVLHQQDSGALFLLYLSLFIPSSCSPRFHLASQLLNNVRTDSGGLYSLSSDLKHIAVIKRKWKITSCSSQPLALNL